MRTQALKKVPTVGRQGEGNIPIRGLVLTEGSQQTHHAQRRLVSGTKDSGARARVHAFTWGAPGFKTGFRAWTRRPETSARAAPSITRMESGRPSVLGSHLPHRHSENFPPREALFPLPERDQWQSRCARVIEPVGDELVFNGVLVHLL